MKFIESKDEFEKVISSFSNLYADKRNLDKISVTEIASDSGVTIGKIYSIFNSKEDIAVSLIEKAVNDVFVIFDDETDPSMHLGDKLKAFISLQLEFIGPNANLINELLVSLVNPFSPFSHLVNETKVKYFSFLDTLLKKNFDKSNFLINLSTPLIISTFMAFNLSVLKYWENDKSDGKQNTLSFIENGVKNFMVITAII